MKRRILKSIVKRVAGEIEAAPEIWKARRDYPVRWEEAAFGHNADIEVEVQILEQSEGQMHLGVTASYGGLNAWCPPMYTILI